MILEYLWIEEYGVIKNQGFNFNPNVFYSFDAEKKILDREDLSEIPKEFFNLTNDTISNISALIGANGTGKSSAFEFICGFLTDYRPLGGFIITDKEIINKSDIEIEFSDNWEVDKPKISKRIDLINTYRRVAGGKEFDSKTADTTNNRLGLRVLDNMIKDTRLIYYSGETNLRHTNRVYQSLLSMSDEYENSFYTDISDIALMANDQRRYRSDKAIYSGENPVLAYRSGESQRFIDLMLSDYRNLIPFSIENLNIGFSFNDINTTFFDSYDEMAFSAIISLMKIIYGEDKEEFTNETILFIDEIEAYGIGGYFNNKFSNYKIKTPEENLRIHLFHNILLRHIREQIMETIGELTERDKLKHYTLLIDEIEKSFNNKESYIDQIKDYFKSTKLGNQFTGRLNLNSVDVFYNQMLEINSWEYEKFNVNLSELNIISKVISALKTFDTTSELKYNISTIFDLNISGLSTGEKQFLKIFSRFVAYNLNNISNQFNEKQFIVLIDEFEIGFHPLWQRKFLKTWIEFLEKSINQLNDGKANKIHVQLIITSHSPFVVSDLPSQCINFISKKDNENHSKVDKLNEHLSTFGANIHELYSDSFFLNGVLMGDFAKGKIDEIFQILSNDKPIEDPEYIKSIIQIIGEPIIKIKLAEMLANKTGENVESARLIAQREYIDQRLIEISNK